MGFFFFYSHKWQTRELQILLNLRKTDKMTNHIIVFFLSHSPFFSPGYVFLWYGWKTEVKKEARCRHSLAQRWSPQQCTPDHFPLGAAYCSLSLLLGYFAHGYLFALHPYLTVMMLTFISTSITLWSRWPLKRPSPHHPDVPEYILKISYIKCTDHAD